MKLMEKAVLLIVSFTFFSTVSAITDVKIPEIQIEELTGVGQRALDFAKTLDVGVIARWVADQLGNISTVGSPEDIMANLWKQALAVSRYIPVGLLAPIIPADTLRIVLERPLEPSGKLAPQIIVDIKKIGLPRARWMLALAKQLVENPQEFLGKIRFGLLLLSLPEPIMEVANRVLDLFDIHPELVNMIARTFNQILFQGPYSVQAFVDRLEREPVDTLQAPLIHDAIIAVRDNIEKLLPVIKPYLPMIIDEVKNIIEKMQAAPQPKAL
ncbi:MAG: hypothetical protein JW725_01160 [Candidatus Babeliaceae bacterium]|nr:hypothetical protein [Candidatus Babeliaceae bacterium]